jgi:hypothetical protein
MTNSVNEIKLKWGILEMSKKQQLVILDKMKETIGYIRDAKKNADSFYSADMIIKNMSEYFCGLAFALEVVTGKEYHWSNGVDGDKWSLVILNNGLEDRQYL